MSGRLADKHCCGCNILRRFMTYLLRSCSLSWRPLSSLRTFQINPTLLPQIMTIQVQEVLESNRQLARKSLLCTRPGFRHAF